MVSSAFLSTVRAEGEHYTPLSLRNSCVPLRMLDGPTLSRDHSLQEAQATEIHLIAFAKG